MRYTFALLALLLAAATSSQAQLGVYAGFTTATLGTANTPRINGGTFGAFYDHSLPVVALGLDLRANYLPTTDNTTAITAITAGPRLALHLPLVPIRPYVEGLVGGAHVTLGQGVARYDGTNAAAGAAAGADFHILPYIDWRVLDYSYTRLIGPHTASQSLTTGLVLRIPFS